MDARTDTYNDVRGLIIHTVQRFNRRFRGDFDEQVCEANYVFMAVYDRYDDNRGSFTSLLVRSIWNRLTDVSVIERRKSIKTEGGESTTFVANRSVSSFSITDFMDTVSDDARILVQLIVEAPAELAEVATGKGDTPCNWRSSLREYLRQRGWGRDRINSGMAEVKAALQ